MSERFVRSAGVEMAPMKQETVLFNPANNKFCVLNQTAAYIWEQLEQPRSLEEISASLAATFANVSFDTAKDDVSRALDELRQTSCIVAATT